MVVSVVQVEGNGMRLCEQGVSIFVTRHENPGNNEVSAHLVLLLSFPLLINSQLVGIVATLLLSSFRRLVLPCLIVHVHGVGAWAFVLIAMMPPEVAQTRLPLAWFLCLLMFFRI